MTPRFRHSANRLFSFSPWVRLLALTTVTAALASCTSTRDVSLEEFARWHDNARAQAQAGTLPWSELYKQSFDRLTALPHRFSKTRG